MEGERLGTYRTYRSLALSLPGAVTAVDAPPDIEVRVVETFPSEEVVVDVCCAVPNTGDDTTVLEDGVSSMPPDNSVSTRCVVDCRIRFW